LAVDRRDIDDASEAALAHALDELPGDVKSASEVNADHGVPIALLHLVEEAVAGDAGAVDQYFNRTVLSLDLLGHGLTGIEVSDVALHPADVMTFGFASSLPIVDLFLFGIDTGGHHPVAGRRQLLADLGTDAAIATGYQCDAIRHAVSPSPFDTRANCCNRPCQPLTELDQAHRDHVSLAAYRALQHERPAS